MTTIVRPLFAVTLLAATLTSPLAARAAEGFAARTFEPAPAGERFLAVPEASVEGHLVPAAALSLGWAQKPLVLQLDGAVVPDGELIRRQLTFHLGLSLSLWNRLLVDVSIPFVASQAGQQPLSGVAAVSGAALEDLRLGARVALLRGERLSVAGGLALWLPTGDVARFGSDGSVRVEPSLLASGRVGSFVYAGDLGVLVRKSRTAVFSEVGPALSYRSALGWLLLRERLQIGPELYGRYQFSGTKTSALEALASARWAMSPRWSIAAALGTRLGPDAPGAAPLRALVQLAWSGEATPPAAEPASPPPPVADAPRSSPFSPMPPSVVEAPPPVPPAPVRKRTSATPEVKVTKTRLEIKERVIFGIATATIQEQSHPILDAVAAVLQHNPQITRVVVEGHTDTMGRRAANLKLSRQRAEAVRAYLVSRGVAPGRLRAKGFGPDRPIGDNANSAGRELNRRVEFVIPESAAR